MHLDVVFQLNHGCRLSIEPLEAENPDLESASEDQRISAAG
jgi:hypothetical protein